MATYTVQTIVDEGIVPTYAAVASTDDFANEGRTFLHVKNSSGGSLTVTITTSIITEGLAVADQAVTIADSAEKMIGPFPTRIYNNASSKVDVAYSATTSVTAAAIKLPT